MIFDDGLSSKDGHWFEIDRGIARHHVERGARVTVVAHAGFKDSADLAALGVRVLPLIEQSSWAGWVPTPTWWDRLARRWPIAAPFREWAGVLEQARHFRAVLRRLLREDAYDCVLHPTALMADFVAWCLMPPSLRDRAGRVVFSTWSPIATYHDDRPPTFARKLAFWKLIAWRLRGQFASGRMLFLTDSVRIGDEYRKAANLDPIVVGGPREMGVVGGCAARHVHGLTFGSLGAARWEKGIDVLQDAIARLDQCDPDHNLRFVIQWNRAVLRPDGTVLPRNPMLAASQRVDWREAVLSSFDYEAALAGIDCMVLPYRRLMYQSRSSAVAVEAACAGIPMIYTADTWLADFVAEQGAGIAVADGDVAGLAEAIRRMAADYPAYKAQAVERSAIARARNSPAAFARVLWHEQNDVGAAGQPA